MRILSITCFILKKVWTNDLLVRHCTLYVHIRRIHRSFDGSERMSCCPSSAVMLVHEPGNVISCHSRRTMRRNSYFAIKITTWILVTKECDILLTLNQNKTLNISLSFEKKQLVDLVKKLTEIFNFLLGRWISKRPVYDFYMKNKMIIVLNVKGNRT